MKKVILTMLVVAGIFGGCADKATPTEFNTSTAEANISVENNTTDANATEANNTAEQK